MKLGITPVYQNEAETCVCTKLWKKTKLVWRGQYKIQDDVVCKRLVYGNEVEKKEIYVKKCCVDGTKKKKKYIYEHKQGARVGL